MILYNIIIINVTNTIINPFQPYGYDYRCNWCPNQLLLQLQLG
jgi:hypothetical protein